MSTGGEETDGQQDDSVRKVSVKPAVSLSTGMDDKPESDMESGLPVENEKDSPTTVCSELPITQPRAFSFLRIAT